MLVKRFFAWDGKIGTAFGLVLVGAGARLSAPVFAAQADRNRVRHAVGGCQAAIARPQYSKLAPATLAAPV